MRTVGAPRIGEDELAWITEADMAEVDRVMIEDLRIELIQMMENAGRSLARVVLEAATPPPPPILDALSRHKAGVVALLRPANGGWTSDDWRVFYDERAGIAEFDGGQPREQAEALAFECCIVEWLNRHPELSDPGRCAWCKEPDWDGHAVVPFGTESHGHTWLHPECWNDWSQDQRQKAQEALAPMGLIARIPP